MGTTNVGGKNYSEQINSTQNLLSEQINNKQDLLSVGIGISMDGSTIETSDSRLSVVASSVDNDGVYQKVSYERPDGTMYAESSLYGSPYDKITVNYYDKDGTSVLESVSWSLLSDSKGVFYSKELLP